MNLRINNRQRCQHLSIPAVRELVLQLLSSAMRRSPDGGQGLDITLHLTDDRGIAAVKQAVFGMPEITDVVALSYLPTPAAPAPEGEIFVNVQRAFTRSCRQGWSPARELALYIAHGLDHLAGADDRTPPERRRMRRRELRWIAAPACLAAMEHLVPPPRGPCGLPSR